MSGFDLQSHLAALYEKHVAKGLRTGLYRKNEDGDLEKHCEWCGEYWPITHEFFSPVNHSVDKFSRGCIACFDEAKR